MQNTAVTKEKTFRDFPVLLKICQLMEKETEAPSMFFAIGLWMARYLDEEDAIDLNNIKETYGERQANTWLVEALVASGKYTSDDGKNIEVIC